MSFKKAMLILLVIIIVLGIVFLLSYRKDENMGNGEDVENNISTNVDKLNVVVTNFAIYDTIKNVAGDNVSLKLLLSPGIDAHSYDPSAQDLIYIKDADIFIYVCETMEKWADKVLDSLNVSEIEIICLIDMIDAIEEEEIDGAEKDDYEEEEDEFDVHIWNSPENAMIIVQKLADVLSDKDKINKETYQKNAKEYIDQIKNVQEKIQEIVDNRVRDRLVFGDKMPMQYFLNEFGLTASAAFNGCSTETEPSATTVAYLIDKVKEEEIPVVLYIELGQGKIAETIAKETGAEVMQIQSLHNISKEDFDNGETYVSLMTRNLEVLKKALQ